MNFYPSFNDSEFINFDLVNFYADNLSELIDDHLFSYKNKDYYETLKLIDKTLQNDSHNSILYSFKGFVLYKLGYIDDALTCCDASLNLDDMIDFNWLAKSIILKKSNHNNDALLCYREFVFLKYGENLVLSTDDFYKKTIDFEIERDYNFEDYYSNNFKTFGELFNQDNLSFINHNNLTLNQYNDILNKISSRSNEILTKTINKYFVDLNHLDLIDKIILYVKLFADVEYKSDGSDLGNYFMNTIVVEDRMYMSHQIFTLIHELTHHLIREIFEQSLMHMLNCSKNELIVYFIYYILENREYKLMDEYCANKVQSRFMPHGYQEFDSFKEIIDNEYDFYSERTDIIMHAQLGKSFSNDILEILEKYIDISLREDIKNQFNLDPHDEPSNKLEFEDIDDLDDEIKIIALNNIIKGYFEKVIANPDEFKNFYEGEI